MYLVFAIYIIFINMSIPSNEYYLVIINEEKH